MNTQLSISRRTLIKLILSTGVGISLIGCKPEIQQEQLQGKTMGTYFVVKYVSTPNLADPKHYLAEINQILETVNEQMSTYRATSEISRFNASQEVNTPFPVSPAVIKVINEAIRIYQLSDGSLDITLLPLVNLWGFGPEGYRDTVPSCEEVTLRKSWTGLPYLEVRGNTLIKKIPQLSLDLSAIAKGYGVDVVAEYLEAQGIERYMVDIGGEVRAKGKNIDDQYWRIAIEKPDVEVEQQALRVISLNNKSVATSGNYRNYFERDGIRYSHTLDPKTGYPIKHRLASVTVIADSCMTADGLATGLGVLGPERGMMLANQLGIPVMMIVKTVDGFTKLSSDAFANY